MLSVSVVLIVSSSQGISISILLRVVSSLVGISVIVSLNISLIPSSSNLLDTSSSEVSCSSKSSYSKKVSLNFCFTFSTALEANSESGTDFSLSSSGICGTSFKEVCFSSRNCTFLEFFDFLGVSFSTPISSGITSS